MITQEDLSWARRVGELQGELKELGAPLYILKYIEAWMHKEAYEMEKRQQEELKKEAEEILATLKAKEAS